MTSVVMNETLPEYLSSQEEISNSRPLRGKHSQYTYKLLNVSVHARRTRSPLQVKELREYAERQHSHNLNKTVKIGPIMVELRHLRRMMNNSTASNTDARLTEIYFTLHRTSVVQESLE